MILLNLMVLLELLHPNLIPLNLLPLDLSHYVTQGHVAQGITHVIQITPVHHLADGLLAQMQFVPQFDYSIFDHDIFDHSIFDHSIFDHSIFDHSVLAQKFDTDVFRGVRGFWNYFLKSGQIWALAIGLVVGYAFRSLTNYG